MIASDNAPPSSLAGIVLFPLLYFSELTVILSPAGRQAGRQAGRSGSGGSSTGQSSAASVSTLMTVVI